MSKSCSYCSTGQLGELHSGALLVIGMIPSSELSWSSGIPSSSSFSSHSSSSCISCHSSALLSTAELSGKSITKPSLSLSLCFTLMVNVHSRLRGLVLIYLILLLVLSTMTVVLMVTNFTAQPAFNSGEGQTVVPAQFVEWTVRQ